MTPLEAAFAAIDSQFADTIDETALITRAKIRGLMAGYAERWKDNEWQTVEVEKEFLLPIINPETESQSRTFRMAGKKDTVLEWPASGKRMMLEHKTTSEDISDPNAPYWRRLAIDSQVSHYMLAEWQSGNKLDGTLYDVIRKPAIRPKKISKAEQAVLASWGKYCERDVPDDCRMLDAENATLYEVRLTAETIQNPDHYYGRRTINRMDHELVEYASELWSISQDMLTARNKGHHYRNDQACMVYGSPCEYLGICSGHDSFESDKWRQSDAVHAELAEAGDGFDVLTNSRIKCFKTCRRKHYFRYELGMKRVDEEERDALFFGTVFHEGLAAYWSCFMKGSQHGSGNATSEVAETGHDRLVGTGQVVG